MVWTCRHVRLDGLCVATETDILLLSDDLRQLVDAAEERGIAPAVRAERGARAADLDPLETDAVYRELETRADRRRSSTSTRTASRRPQPQPAPQPLQISWETTTDALQLFLREAGRHPLLTAAQEVELAKKIEARATCWPSSG